MSTNPKTKAYWKRVNRMAWELEFRLSSKYDDRPVTDILAAKDPKATLTMHCEAVKEAYEGLGRSARYHTEEAERDRIAQKILQEFREPIPLYVIEGGKS